MVMLLLCSSYVATVWYAHGCRFCTFVVFFSLVRVRVLFHESLVTSVAVELLHVFESLGASRQQNLKDTLGGRRLDRHHEWQIAVICRLCQGVPVQIQQILDSLYRGIRCFAQRMQRQSPCVVLGAKSSSTTGLNQESNIIYRSVGSACNVQWQSPVVVGNP